MCVMAVVGMANETNRFSAGDQVEIDEQFKSSGQSRATKGKRL